jgi:hypothetical protein
VASLFFEMAVPIKRDRLFVDGHIFRVQFGLRRFDALEMAKAVDTSDHHRGWLDRACWPHTGRNVNSIGQEAHADAQARHTQPHNRTVAWATALAAITRSLRRTRSSGVGHSL